MTGYSDYEQISCKKHPLCWGHARRYFVEAISTEISQEEAVESTSGQAIRKINELFVLDKDFSYKSAEEKHVEHLRLEKDKPEAFFV
ncbi:MAG: transposase [Selenomonadaceae bacterium]|nr:transposase [Selenomonadaceae bacterium]